MALTDGENGNMVMPVAPMCGGGNGGFGNGFGGDWAWIILLLLAFGGGWGNGFGGGFGADGLYPWLNNSQNINGGFRDQMLGSQISGIQNAITSGFGDVQTALCGGFAGVNAGISNAAAQVEISANARQMANMNQVVGLSTQLADCCCENRLATCQTQNIIQTESAATRAAMQDAVQTVLDKLCQQEIDALKDRNAELRTQVSMQNLAASQAAQTAALVADNTAQTQYIVNRVAPYPVPSYTVANPNTPAA